MSKQQSCRTCVYWGVPEGRRVLKDRLYPCTAPVAHIMSLLPDSIQRFGDRRHMERDSGKNCPCWADTFPVAPKP